MFTYALRSRSFAYAQDDTLVVANTAIDVWRCELYISPQVLSKSSWNCIVSMSGSIILIHEQGVLKTYFWGNIHVL